jgi:Zn-dependent protease with chaperone function
MNELAFPLLGTLGVFLLAVPAVTLVSKGALFRRRKSTGHLPNFGTNGTWLLAVAPVIASVVWFISAALHQSEPGGAVEACMNHHLGSDVCQDALAFAMGLTLLVLYFAAIRIRSELTRRVLTQQPDMELGGYTARIERVCASNRSLHKLCFTVLARSTVPICTIGIFKPRIEVTAELLDALDDHALIGALLHEAAHVRAYDPLRLFILSLCQSLNPAAFLLRPEADRWRLAREAACDEEAVMSGGDPLSLAQAIVTAARCATGPAPVHAVPLGGRGMDNIQLRVGLLLRQADGCRAADRSEVPLLGLAILLSLVAALPHVLGSGPLDTMHIGIETALVVLGIS